LTAEDTLHALTDLATPLAVRTAVTLRLPDRIAAGTTTLDELAATCGADRDALARLLRYLAHKGVFVETSPDVFALTEVGELLCGRSSGGHGAYLDLEGLGARMDLAFLGLPHAVRTGEPGYASVHGRDLWADLDATPGFRAYFDALMRSLQHATAPEVAALYPWRDVKHVADVGGGSGGLLAELLTAHPHLRGTLVDRPEPVATAAQLFAERGLAERVEAVAGDFFQALPRGADVYLISRALTDWGDAEATAILRRCAEAAGSTGRVLVIEVLPAEPNSYDLKMLVVVGGRERGLEDHLALAAAAGLKTVKTYIGTAGLTLMEFAAFG
jgi:precorrin-6B methylase 2